MAESRPELKWQCVGITQINGNPFFKVKLMQKKHTNKYKVVVDGPMKEEFEMKGWDQAEAKYLELTKKYHQSIII